MRPLPQNFSPARILVRGVNWLGDAVMTTPALLRLREHFPRAHITLLTPAKLADLWHEHPALDNTLTIAAGEGLWTVARRLSQENFDLALVLPNSPRSAMEGWLAGIPVRLGLARAWRNGFLTHPVPLRPGHIEMRKRSVGEIQRLQHANQPPEPPPPPAAHHLHQYLHLVAALGGNPSPVPPQLVVPDATLHALRCRLGQIGTPLVGINPGAEYGPAKRWPVEKYAALAQTLTSRFKAHLILLGGPNDQAITKAIEQAVNVKVINWAGATALAELCAALKLCDVLVTNDTGPMHLAAAVGTPVVAIFGSTSPWLTGPGLPEDARHQWIVSNAPCRPCFLRQCPTDFRCMNGITVEQVLAAVERVLGTSCCDKPGI